MDILLIATNLNQITLRKFKLFGYGQYEQFIIRDSNKKKIYPGYEMATLNKVKYPIINNLKYKHGGQNNLIKKSA